MIRHHQRHARGAEMMHLPAQAPERASVFSRFWAAIRPTASMIRGLKQRDLPLEVGQALGGLERRGIAVARRPALQDIGDVHLLAREADGPQHGVEQLARAADERLALAVLLGPGRLPDDQPLAPRGCRRRTRSGCASCSSGQRVHAATAARSSAQPRSATPSAEARHRAPAPARRRPRAAARSAAGTAAQDPGLEAEGREVLAAQSAASCGRRRAARAAAKQLAVQPHASARRAHSRRR